MEYVRKLKSHQKGPWCDWCKPDKVRATHRNVGIHKHHSCPNHVEELNQLSKESENLTEADYQTWVNL